MHHFCSSDVVRRLVHILRSLWDVDVIVSLGSIIPAITAHVTANIMGLPQPGWELRQHPKQKKCL